MAAFREHILFSSALGVAYTATLKGCGFGGTHALLAGGLCGVAGMLPDMDSDSGKPVRELFGLTAAIVPLLLFQRLLGLGFTPEGTILFTGALYLIIRFGLAWVFKHLTVHRGMFHSLPAAVIVAEITILAHDSPQPHGGYILAGGTFLGFLSHLVLDGLYGLRVTRLLRSQAGGSPLKLASDSLSATLTTWLLLGVLLYFVGVRQGYFQSVALTHAESREAARR